MKSKDLCCSDVKPLKVGFCPKCKSKDVKSIYKLKNLFGLLPRIECERCGHGGESFPIIISNKKGAKK
jgi:hypothetical protein